MKKLVFILLVLMCTSIANAKTEAELYAEITAISSVYTIGEKMFVEQQNDVREYTLPIFVKDGDNVNKKKVTMYIVNEGKVTEEAYLRDNSVKKAQTYTDIVNNFIKSKITAGAILAGQIMEINEDHNFAVIKAFSIGSTTDIVYYLMTKEGQNFKLTIINNYK